MPIEDIIYIWQTKLFTLSLSCKDSLLALFIIKFLCFGHATYIFILYSFILYHTLDTELSHSILIHSSSIRICLSSNWTLSLSLNSSKRTLSALMWRFSFSCSCDSLIHFIFFAKYSPTSFLLAFFFRLAFLAFLPIGLSKVVVSSSMDTSSPSAIGIESGVGSNTILNFSLGILHFGWFYTLPLQFQSKKIQRNRTQLVSTSTIVECLTRHTIAI